MSEEHSDSTMTLLSSLFSSEETAINSDVGATEEYGSSATESVDGQAAPGRAKAATGAGTQSSSGVAEESTRVTETETATGGSTSSTTRERGTRTPFSSFLRDRDDYDPLDTEAMLYGYTSWDSWEEPTEELDPLCCVCMVGLKGAAFIPCGHTFCRKCSRELWRGRRTCPLCNKNVREILDIF